MMGHRDTCAFFDKRNIQIGRIPPKILEKARVIIARIERGETYTAFRGKRLNANREKISIPVGRKWRMLARERPNGLQVYAVLSHETYNRLV
jgi:hypothetical protein